MLLKTFLARGPGWLPVRGSLKVPTSLSCPTLCFPLGVRSPGCVGREGLGISEKPWTVPTSA